MSNHRVIIQLSPIFTVRSVYEQTTRVERFNLKHKSITSLYRIREKTEVPKVFCQM